MCSTGLALPQATALRLSTTDAPARQNPCRVFHACCARQALNCHYGAATMFYMRDVHSLLIWCA